MKLKKAKRLMAKQRKVKRDAIKTLLAYLDKINKGEVTE